MQHVTWADMEERGIATVNDVSAFEICARHFQVSNAE